MNNLCTDIGYLSLNKWGEQLCGDRVEIVEQGENSSVIVLADGMGSGVKANILSTLTSKIICTMMANGMPIEECVDTIVKTLPVCSVRKLAYSTFSVLEISENGDGYLAEFDNPFCFYLRNGEQQEFRPEYNEYSGRGVYETHFKAEPGDIITLVSDGVIWAGVGDNMNFGWTWDSVAAWLDAMRAAGIQDVTLKLYRGGRHEIINETNRAEVYEDILTWCNGHV